MTIALKNDNNTPLIIPSSVRRKAGFRSGQVLEIKASGGAITIVPKAPNAADEYTPAQRRAIDAELKQSLEEVRRGQVAGPFDTAEEMIASLKRQLRRRAAKKTKLRRR